MNFNRQQFNLKKVIVSCSIQLKSYEKSSNDDKTEPKAKKRKLHDVINNHEFLEQMKE